MLGEHWFVFRRSAPQDLDPDLAEVPVLGFVVVTQTCDLVRDCAVRPYLEVSPLVEVPRDELHAIERGRLPKYAYIPGLIDKLLVADLDRTMTVEKSVVAEWDRQVGCRSDEEARSFSAALARKRNRPAFPDDFNKFVGKLQRRLTEKHGKDSDEGAALRALREIRVLASPDWEAAACKLLFYFIRDEQTETFGGTPWADHKTKWMALIPSSGRFTTDGQVTTLSRMNASDYVHSDALDLDHLSKPSV